MSTIGSKPAAGRPAGMRRRAAGGRRRADRHAPAGGGRRLTAGGQLANGSSGRATGRRWPATGSSAQVGHHCNRHRLLNKKKHICFGRRPHIFFSDARIHIYIYTHIYIYIIYVYIYEIISSWDKLVFPVICCCPIGPYGAQIYPMASKWSPRVLSYALQAPSIQNRPMSPSAWRAGGKRRVEPPGHTSKQQIGPNPLVYIKMCTCRCISLKPDIYIYIYT